MVSSMRLKQSAAGTNSNRSKSKRSNASARREQSPARFGVSQKQLPLWKQLDPYQREPVDIALEIKTLAILFDQGTGKTFVAGGIVEALANEAADRSYLLIVPLSNKISTWVKFIKKHLPQMELCFTLEEYDRAFANRLLLMHYEQVAPIIDKLKRRKWTLILYDESQRLKDRNSLQSRTAAKLRNSGEFKIILSGTPIDERPSDLWAQFKFMRPQVFGSRWKDFEDEFMEPIEGQNELTEGLKHARPRSFKWFKLMRDLQIRRRKRKFDFDKLPEFLELASPWIVRVMQEDVLDLKPPIYKPVPIHMFGEQRRLYDTLERDLVVTVKKKTITAPMKAVKIWKCHQICGGYLKDEDGDTHEVGRAKLRRLLILARKVEGPVVIFCRYTAEANAIAKALRRVTRGRIELFTGKTKQKDRPKIQEDFQAGKIDFLVAQIRTGGVGIDLFRANIVFVYSFNHSWIDFDQAIKRLQRRGQTRQVTIFLLFIAGTIDVLIRDAILKKRKIVEYVLGQIGRKSKWRSNSALPISPINSASSRRRRVSHYARPASSRRKDATRSRTRRTSTR